MKTRSQPTLEAAETLAVQAFAFIAEEPESLARFLGITGITIEQIRAASRQPGFLAGVLDHMLGDEKLLAAFAQSAGIDPAEVPRAARALSGHWERDLP